MDAKTHLIKEVFQFERDFPDGYLAMRALFGRALGSDELADDEDFRYSLGEIVYAYGGNGSATERRRSAGDLLESLGELQQKMDAVSESISVLGPIYQSRISKFLSLNGSLLEPDFNIGHVVRDLERAGLALALYRLGLTFAVYDEVGKNTGRARPRLPYLIPTIQLIEVLELHAGLTVVAPKHTATGADGSIEAAQPTTEFIRLGLRMIDRSITVAQTMTSIKNALGLRKKYNGNPWSMLIAPPDLKDLNGVLGKIKAFEGKI